MKLLCRACGHTDFRHFRLEDLTTWDRDIAQLTGVSYGGVNAP